MSSSSINLNRLQCVYIQIIDMFCSGIWSKWIWANARRFQIKYSTLSEEKELRLICFTSDGAHILNLDIKYQDATQSSIQLKHYGKLYVWYNKEK